VACEPATRHHLPGHLAATLRFPATRTGKLRGQLDIDELDAPRTGDFYLECDRGKSPYIRNARPGAIRSIFGYADLRHPEHAGTTACVLDIPARQAVRPTTGHLTYRIGGRCTARHA
jgi:hypothetical protein